MKSMNYQLKHTNTGLDDFDLNDKEGPDQPEKFEDLKLQELLDHQTFFHQIIVCFDQYSILIALKTLNIGFNAESLKNQKKKIYTM